MYTLIGFGDSGISFFRMNQDFRYNVVKAGCVCTVGEMNAMLTVVFLNEMFNPYHSWLKFLLFSVNL